MGTVAKEKGHLMKPIMLIFVVLTVGLAQAAGVYKYTNKQGKTSYSDVPIDGAEKIIVPPVMTYKPPVIEKKQPMPDSPANKDADQRVPYQHIEITSPQEQGTVRNNQGNVTVGYLLEPSLQKGDRLELNVDGKISKGLSIQGLVRGEHTISIQVISSSGEVLISSPSITFYLHRHTKL
jgi:hypothetical protein